MTFDIFLLWHNSKPSQEFQGVMVMQGVGSFPPEADKSQTVSHLLTASSNASRRHHHHHHHFHHLQITIIISNRNKQEREASRKFSAHENFRLIKHIFKKPLSFRRVVYDVSILASFLKNRNVSDGKLLPISALRSEYLFPVKMFT